MLQYLKQLAKPPLNPRLIMSILCKNEVDIIEANIRTHATLGVDGFVVMDNASTDGTREILSELSKEFDIHIIDQPAQTYQQAKWMTGLAHTARKALGATWVISNDADEFWIPESGDLKSNLCFKDSVITVPRSNMLLTKEALNDGYHFSDLHWRVGYPIAYPKQAELHDDKVSMFFPNISPKTIVNTHSFWWMHGGNHRAEHAAKLFTKRREETIRVYHYPIRSWEQFGANIKNRVKLLEVGASMGPHYRRWVRLLKEGKLHEEFNARLVINQTQLDILEPMGIVKEDASASRAIKTALDYA